MKFCIVFFLLFVFIGYSATSPLAEVMQSSDNTYQLNIDDSGSGFSTDTSRSTDQSNAFILIGSFEPFDAGEGNTAGSAYRFNSGLQPTFEANVASVSIISAVDAGVNLYNRLLFSISPNNNPTSATGVQFAVQISTDNFATFKYINPATFSADAITSPDMSVYYKPCAQTTSAPADDNRWDCGTVSGLKRYLNSLSPGKNYCARVVAKNGDATNSIPGPYSCATTNNLTISFPLSSNSSKFNTLIASKVNAASPSVTLTSNTNAVNGYSVYVQGTGSGTGSASGPFSGLRNHLITSTATNLDSVIGTDAFGMQASVASGNPSLSTADWDPTQAGRNSTWVGQVLRSANKVLYSRSGANTSQDEVATSYKSTVSAGTPASTDYREILIFTMLANW